MTAIATHADGVEIVLEKSLVGHGTPVSRITLREPTGRDYLAYGEPVNHARNPDGTFFAVENEDIIRKYIFACLPDTVNEAMADQLCLADAMALKNAILDFFQAARLRKLEK